MQTTTDQKSTGGDLTTRICTPLTASDKKLLTEYCVERLTMIISSGRCPTDSMENLYNALSSSFDYAQNHAILMAFAKRYHTAGNNTLRDAYLGRATSLHKIDSSRTSTSTASNLASTSTSSTKTTAQHIPQASSPTNSDLQLVEGCSFLANSELKKLSQSAINIKSFEEKSKLYPVFSILLEKTSYSETSQMYFSLLKIYYGCNRFDDAIEFGTEFLNSKSGYIEVTDEIGTANMLLGLSCLKQSAANVSYIGVFSEYLEKALSFFKVSIECSEIPISEDANWYMGLGTMLSVLKPSSLNPNTLSPDIDYLQALLSANLTTDDKESLKSATKCILASGHRYDAHNRNFYVAVLAYTAYGDKNSARDRFVKHCKQHPKHLCIVNEFIKRNKLPLSEISTNEITCGSPIRQPAQHVANPSTPSLLRRNSRLDPRSDNGNADSKETKPQANRSSQYTEDDVETSDKENSSSMDNSMLRISVNVYDPKAGEKLASLLSPRTDPRRTTISPPADSNTLIGRSPSLQILFGLTRS